MENDIEYKIQEIISLNRLLESAKKANEQLSRENIQLRNINSILEAEKKQWEQSKELQNVIIQQSLNNSNQTNQSQAEELQRLKDELRILKNRDEK